MDPASAGVAFVSFAASIASLSAITLKSCKNINNIAHSLKHAPDNIHRLCSKVERLQRLITEIERIGSELGHESLGIDLQKDWTTFAMAMKTDVVALEKKISRLQKSLNEKSSSKIHVSVRVRMYFSAEEVDKYEAILSDHVEAINILLSILSK